MLCKRCGRDRSLKHMETTTAGFSERLIYTGVCSAKESCKQHRKKNRKMVNDIYVINLSRTNASDLRKWAADIPDDYTLSIDSLEATEYDDILVAVKPR